MKNLFILVALIIWLQIPLAAQIVLQKTELNTAGGTLSNANLKTSFSVGNPAVGVLQDGGNSFKTIIGFFPLMFNQNPTALFIAGGSVKDIDENKLVNGADNLVGILTTTDPEVNDTHTYTLVSGGGDVDNASFTIVGNQLFAAEVFDFEIKNAYTIRVQTDDGDGGTFAASFTINVNNINDAPTDLFIDAAAIDVVDENLASGETIGTLTTTDQDISSAGDTHAYSLAAGVNDNDLFTISGNQLLTAATFDFETKTSYLLTLRTTDTGGSLPGGGLTFDKDITININDTNDGPTDIVFTSNPSYPENLAIGTTFATLASTDQDAVDTHSYSLVSGTGDTDNGLFQVVNNEIRNTSILNFERTQGPIFNVRVQTTDTGSKIFQKQFTVTVTNVDDAPSSLTNTSFNIVEGNSPNATLGLLIPIDDDLEANDNSNYAWVLLPQLDHASFLIGTDLGTGIKTLAANSTVFNYATKSLYNIIIRVSDIKDINGANRAEGILFGEIPITVQVLSATGPNITSFSPQSGPVGTSVTIGGTNFSTTPTNNIVKFNGTVASVTGTPTTTSIVTSVPVGATTGPISVEVGSQVATSVANFTVGGILISEPSTQASNLVITQPFATTINVSWTIGNGTSRIVVAKGGGVVDQAPVDGVTYIASSSFSSGDDLGGGNYVVYNGTGNSVSVTDIQASTSYQFFVFEYNGNAGSEDYNISTATNNPKSNSATSVPDISIPYSSFGSAESNYRIIAVPLNLTNNKVSDVFDELMPYDDTKWRMFHYQNGSNQEMNGNSTISPGKGYWLIVKDNKTFTSGPGATVLAPFSVPLVQGWNQIGNPYNFNISWADVQAANPGLPGLRKWINTMTDGTTLSKMEGGFVNATAAGTLAFPAIDNGGRTRGEGELVRNSLNSPNWQVYLNADQGNLMNRIAGVGMNTKANDEYDIYDGLSMPHFFDSYLDVNHNKEMNGNFFSKDIVATTQNHVWEFSVNTSGPEEVITFSWDNSYFGDNDRELYLYDVAMQRSIDMRTTSTYAFNRNVSNTFKVLFGSAEFVKEKGSVNELVLHKAWPNPADQEINIAFSLPETGQDQAVNLELVDLLGRKIWSQDQLYASGFHEVQWQRGKEARSGVYLFIIKLGNEIRQMKMVLK